MRFTAINQPTGPPDDTRGERHQTDSARQRQPVTAKTREALESEAFQKYNEALEFERSGDHAEALKLLREVGRSDMVNAFIKKLQRSSDGGDSDMAAPAQRSQVGDPAFSRLCYLVFKNVAFILMDHVDELLKQRNSEEHSAQTSTVFSDSAKRRNEMIEEVYSALHKAVRIDDCDPICWLRMAKFSAQVGLPEFAYLAYRRVAECGERFSMASNRLVICELLKHAVAFLDVDRCLWTLRAAIQHGALALARHDDELLLRGAFCVRSLLDCCALDLDEAQLESPLSNLAQVAVPEQARLRFSTELETIREQMRGSSSHVCRSLFVSAASSVRTVDFGTLKLAQVRNQLAESNVLAQTTIVLNAVLKEYGDSVWSTRVDLARLLAFLERASLASVPDDKMFTTAAPVDTDQTQLPTSNATATCSSTTTGPNAIVKPGSKRKWALVDERFVEKRRSARTSKLPDATDDTNAPTEDDQATTRAARSKQPNATQSQPQPQEHERFADRLTQFVDRHLLATFQQRVATLRSLGESRCYIADSNECDFDNSSSLGNANGADAETTAFVGWFASLRGRNSILFVHLVDAFLFGFIGRASLRRVRLASSGFARRAFIELVEAYFSRHSNSVEQWSDAYSHHEPILTAFANVTLVYADCWLQQAAEIRGTTKTVATGPKEMDLSPTFRRAFDCTLLAVERLANSAFTSPCMAREHRNAVLLIEAECNLMRSRMHTELDAQRRAAETSRFLFDCLREATDSEDAQLQSVSAYFEVRARERLAEMTVQTLLLSALRLLEVLAEADAANGADADVDTNASVDQQVQLAVRSFLLALIGCEESRATLADRCVMPLTNLTVNVLRRRLDELNSTAGVSLWISKDLKGKERLNWVTLFVFDAVGGVLQRNAALTRVTVERFDKVLLGIVELVNMRLAALTSDACVGLMRSRYDSALGNWLQLAVEHLHATPMSNVVLSQNLIALVSALLRTYPTPAATLATCSMPHSVAQYGALFIAHCLRAADTATLGRQCKRVANNRRLWLAFYAALPSTPSPSPKLLSLIHEYLGHVGECRAHDFELLRFAVRHLSPSDSDALFELHQSFACLFGIEVGAAFQANSAYTQLPDCDDHRCADADMPLTLSVTDVDVDLLLRFVYFYRFAELPEYDSYKSLSASADVEQFTRRVIQCIPAPLVRYAQQLTDSMFEQLLVRDNDVYDLDIYRMHDLRQDAEMAGETSTPQMQGQWSLQGWVAEQMAVEPPPETEDGRAIVSFELIAELHFLVGDYLVKNTEFSASLAFLRSAACWCAMAQAVPCPRPAPAGEDAHGPLRLAFIRFNTWALLALAQQGLIDAQLAETAMTAASRLSNVTNRPVFVPTLDLARTRLAFEQALRCCADANSDDSAKYYENLLKLAAEHAAFLYVVHSYASRTLKLSVSAPSEELVNLSRNMLRRAQSALQHLLTVCETVAHVDADADNASDSDMEAQATTDAHAERDTAKSEEDADSACASTSPTDSSVESDDESKCTKKQTHAENEHWFAHYLLGKCAEKVRRNPRLYSDPVADAHQSATRSPVERAAAHYLSAMQQLERLALKHPKIIRRTFAVPPRFSVESIELFYRLTRIILDRLIELLQLWPIVRDDSAAAAELRYLEDTLRQASNSSFVRAHAHAVHEVGSSELVALGLLLRPTALPSSASSSTSVDDCFGLMQETCDVVATLADLTDFAGRIASVRECVTNLELCVARFPKYFKAHVRLARYFTMLADGLRERAKRGVRGAAQLNTHADALISVAMQHMLGARLDEPGGSLFTVKSKGAKGNALLSERRSNNIFNGVWMLPIQDLDRPGSFISALYRAGCLLVDVLFRSRSLNALDEVFAVLKPASQSDSQRAERTYLRDFELHCLLLRTIHRYAALAHELRRAARLDRDALETLLVRLLDMLPVFESSCAQLGCSGVPECGSSFPECALPLPIARDSFVASLRRLVIAIHCNLRGTTTVPQLSSQNEDSLWQLAVAHATSRVVRSTSSKPPAVRKQHSVNSK